MTGKILVIHEGWTKTWRKSLGFSLSEMREFLIELNKPESESRVKEFLELSKSRMWE